MTLQSKVSCLGKNVGGKHIESKYCKYKSIWAITDLFNSDNLKLLLSYATNYTSAI